MRRKLEKLKALGWIRESENGGLSLNPDTVPPLAERFKDYNQTLLIRMRKSLQQLEALHPQRTPEITPGGGGAPQTGKRQPLRRH